jgi:hypothetical protein
MLETRPRSVYFQLTQEVLGKANRLIFFDTTRTGQQTIYQRILSCRGNVSIQLLPSIDWSIQRHPKLSLRPTLLLLWRIFVAERTCLLRRCLARNGGINVIEPLPSYDRRHTHGLM